MPPPPEPQLRPVDVRAPAETSTQPLVSATLRLPKTERLVVVALVVVELNVVKNVVVAVRAEIVSKMPDVIVARSAWKLVVVAFVVVAFVVVKEPVLVIPETERSPVSEPPLSGR